MIRFDTDYTEGAHPRILERLLETNLEQTIGYGEDEYCRRAADKIREAAKAPGAAVHFLVGWTQTNTTVIASALRPYQGVLSADSGHINVHETGAIEAAGHKVLALPAPEGKLTAEQIAEYVDWQALNDSAEHMVQPGMVYLSNPTEVGTIYSRKELTAISTVCKSRGIYLFLDGARLGYGLMCPENDLALEDLARLCDVFYIGGTKVGALFGEAVVIMHDSLKRDFRYSIKQHGGLLAKGRLLGIQFLALFEDNLYFEISSHAIEMARKLKRGLLELGIPFYMDSPTNQQFVILPDTVCQELAKGFAYEYQERMDEGRSAIRFCTCWATREEQVQELLAELKRLTEDAR